MSVMGRFQTLAQSLSCARPMRAPQRIPRLPTGLALRPEPAAVRADDFAALLTMLQVGRLRRFGHGAAIRERERFGNGQVALNLSVGGRAQGEVVRVAPG